MGVNILETKAKEGVTKFKTNLLLSCSCGKNYRVKEKFEETCVRPTTCPKCKEIHYIRYGVVYKTFSDGYVQQPLVVG
ncbi:MAG: hypothetical protein PHQ66_01360 [Candidatus Nanoarchaeia archaeon]|nr:hypothetical protein [Candidatus Nanoarchaeia archaeon]MDD5357976.1 hypothetical protein [Candidatus Nanoarchaeia archaeon]MDD5588895.1 hypothetical protein [Candidatus Nanoarchaeia archaeon]